MSTCYSPVRHSTRIPKDAFAFDLHVLSTPPAFVLSQDQTLQFDSSRSASTASILASKPRFYFTATKPLTSIAALDSSKTDLPIPLSKILTIRAAHHRSRTRPTPLNQQPMPGANHNIYPQHRNPSRVGREICLKVVFAVPFHPMVVEDEGRHSHQQGDRNRGDIKRQSQCDFSTGIKGPRRRQMARQRIFKTSQCLGTEFVSQYGGVIKDAPGIELSPKN